MTDELRRALEAAAERGRPAGAEAVVDRAMMTVASHPDATGRVVRGVVAAAVAVALAAGGVYAFTRNQLGGVARVPVGSAVAPGAPMNVLLVGTDAANAKSPRADTIIVVRVEPATNRVAMLSLPRDLWTGNVRLSAVFEQGPQALAQAVKDTTGIEVNHYVEIDFAGFERIVDAVGGVEVPFAAPARDAVSGLAVAESGCVRLDGRTALAYVRSRHFEAFEGGRWKADPTGDIGRISRQHVFLRQFGAALSEIGNPVELKRLIDATASHVTVDDDFSTRELLRLRDARRAPIESWTLPTLPATVGGAAVLRLNQPDASDVVARFLNPGPAAPAQSSPTVPNACA